MFSADSKADEYQKLRTDIQQGVQEIKNVWYKEIPFSSEQTF